MYFTWWSLMILREETVVLFKRPTRPNIFLQVDLDSLTTCDHPYWNTYIIAIRVMREHDLDYTFLKIQHIFYPIIHISVIKWSPASQTVSYNLQGGELTQENERRRLPLDVLLAWGCIITLLGSSASAIIGAITLYDNSLFWTPGFDHPDCPALLL